MLPLLYVILVVIVITIIYQRYKYATWWSGFRETAFEYMFHRHLKYRVEILNAKDNEQYVIQWPIFVDNQKNKSNHLWICCPGAMKQLSECMETLHSKHNVFDNSDWCVFNQPGINLYLSMKHKPIPPPTNVEYLFEFIQILKDKRKQYKKISLIGVSMGGLSSLFLIDKLSQYKPKQYIEQIVMVHSPELIRETFESLYKNWFFRFDIVCSYHVYKINVSSSSIWDTFIGNKIKTKWYHGWLFMKEITEIIIGSKWNELEYQWYNPHRIIKQYQQNGEIKYCDLKRIIAKNDPIVPWNSIDQSLFKYYHTVVVMNNGGHCTLTHCPEIAYTIKKWNQQIYIVILTCCLAALAVSLASAVVMTKVLGAEMHTWADILAMIFGILACILSGFQIYKHIYYDHHPEIRKCIIRILLMIIIYSITALLGLYQPEQSMYYNVIRDTYESIVIYSFYELLVYSLGGYKNVLKQLSFNLNVSTYPHLFPFNFCFKPIQLNTINNNQSVTYKYVRSTTIGVLQYCFIQITMAVITFCLEAVKKLNNGTFAYNAAYLWVIIIRSISQFYAIYCLILFYFILNELNDQSSGYKLFKTLRAIPKFLCIKGIIFFTFWQSVLINLLVFTRIIKPEDWFWTADHIGSGLQDFIICIEMLLFSFAHWYSFRVIDFKKVKLSNNPNTSSKSPLKILFNAAFIGDLINDAKSTHDKHKYLGDSDSNLDSQSDSIHNSEEIIVNRNKLKYYHSLLIVITNIFCALFFKAMIVFIPFIMNDYGYSYSFIATSLAIGSLTTSSALFLNSLLLNLKSNLMFFILCIIECISIFILWYFRNQSNNLLSSQIFFIVGVIILSNMEQITWGVSNSIISSFTVNKTLLHQSVTALNSGWTFATFLFIPSGYIMKYLSFWVYLEILFVIFLCLSILNLLIIPKISVNQYNLMYHSNSNQDLDLDQNESNLSIQNDLKTLWNIKRYRIIIVITIFMFLSFAYFYASFAVWFKELYNFNQFRFGVIAALMEGIGNLGAMLSILCLTNNDTNNKNKYKISETVMMIFFGFLVFISMGIIVLVNYISYFTQIFICVLTSLFFCGSEGVCLTALNMSVSEVPPIQQARSSSIIAITQSITIFIAQSTIAFMYSEDGMKFISSLLSVVYLICLMFIIYLHKLIKGKELKDELIWINKNKNTIAKYT